MHTCVCMTQLEATGSLSHNFSLEVAYLCTFTSAALHWSQIPSLVHHGQGLCQAGPPGGRGHWATWKKGLLPCP